jgi:hypothetical protein
MESVQEHQVQEQQAPEPAAPVGDPLQERIQAIVTEEMAKALATLGENTSETLIRQAIERVKSSLGALTPQALLSAAINRPTGPVRQLQERLNAYVGSDSFVRLCNERIEHAIGDIMEPNHGSMLNSLLAIVSERIDEAVAERASSRAWSHIRSNFIQGGSENAVRLRLIDVLGRQTTLSEDLLRAYQSDQVAQEIAELRQVANQFRQHFPEPMGINVLTLDGGFLVNGMFHRIRFLSVPPTFANTADNWHFSRLPIDPMTQEGFIYCNDNLVLRSGQPYLSPPYRAQIREFHQNYTPGYPANGYILFGPYAYPISSVALLTAAPPWQTRLDYNRDFFKRLNRVLMLATYINAQHPLPGPWMWQMIYEILADQESFAATWLKSDYRFLFHRNGAGHSSACYLDTYNGQVFTCPPPNHRLDIPAQDINHYTRHGN